MESTFQKPKPKKEFRKQDHGDAASRKGRDKYNSYEHDWQTRGERGLSKIAVREALSEIYAEDFNEGSDTSTDGAIEALTARFPYYELAVNENVQELIDEMQRGEADIDDVVSAYRNALGPDADFSDAEMLIYEYLDQKAKGWLESEEDKAHDINVRYDADEDEAYSINVRIDK